MTHKAGRTFFIRTFGCKVNQYETQAMREALLRAGFIETADRAAAGVCIVNSCTVTDRADKESRYYLNLLERVNPHAKIVLTGCLASQDTAFLRSLSNRTHILPNVDKPSIAAIAGADGAAPSALSISTFKDRTKAFLKIQDGCENFCSYCKVPYVRGPFSSKPIDEIAREVEALSAAGFKEIVLTGICLGAWGKGKGEEGDVRYGGKGAGLLTVLRALDVMPGDFRLRLSSIEHLYVTDALIDHMASGRRMCRHLHIPLQSGDDEILRAMNRRYASAAFRKTVDAARTRIPGIAFTTDVIVGFPGETDAHFSRTAAFLRGLAPLKTHIFTFSPREGTAASFLGHAPDARTAKERHRQLAAIDADASYRYRLSMVGSGMPVLVESRRDRTTGLLCGYTDTYVRVLFSGPDDLMGSVIPVTITEVTSGSTKGMCVKKSA